MKHVNALIENEETQAFVDANQEILTEASQYVGWFQDVCKDFVKNNKAEFVFENLEETEKNIRVFGEIACAQFLTELTTAISQEIGQGEALQEAEMEKYL